MDVEGRSEAREAYRVVSADGLRGYVPESLMASGGRPSHQQAYEWLDRHARQITAALAVKACGGHAKKPFDRIVLREED